MSYHLLRKRQKPACQAYAACVCQQNLQAAGLQGGTLAKAACAASEYASSSLCMPGSRGKSVQRSFLVSATARLVVCLAS